MDYTLSNLLLFTGRPRPHLRPTDVAIAIDEARRFASPMIEQLRIEYTQSTEQLAGPVGIDEDLLRQVLLNLLLNAVDAMPEGGRLSVNAATDQTGGLSIAVADTGTGIPDSILPKIFDPFFTTKQQGTGLGLAIVHNAVTALSGAIRIETGAGRGTAVHLSFPARPAAALTRTDAAK